MNTFNLIASIPLWIAGFFFFYISFQVIKDRRPGETNVDLAVQFLISFAISLILLRVAAWLSQ